MFDPTKSLVDAEIQAGFVSETIAPADVQFERGDWKCLSADSPA